MDLELSKSDFTVDTLGECRIPSRRLQIEHELEFPLLHGFAESVPLPDESLDFAISEYGPAIWADPHQWIPGAFRLLRSGGRLRWNQLLHGP